MPLLGLYIKLGSCRATGTDTPGCPPPLRRYQADVNAARHGQAASAETFRRQQAAAAAEVLQRQMQEKTSRTQALDSTYAGEIRPEYFTQFGTSHR